jgi:hypothetical protein
VRGSGRWLGQSSWEPWASPEQSVGRAPRDLGRVLARLGQVWAEFLERLGRVLARLGQVWAEFKERPGDLGKCGQSSWKGLGQVLAKAVARLGQVWAS